MRLYSPVIEDLSLDQLKLDAIGPAHVLEEADDEFSPLTTLDMLSKSRALKQPLDEQSSRRQGHQVTLQSIRMSDVDAT